MWIAATYFFSLINKKNSSSEYYFIVKWRKYFLNWGLPFSTEDPFVIYFFSPLFPTLPYSPLLFCDRFCLHGMVFQLCLIIIWMLSEILMLKTSFLVFIKKISSFLLGIITTHRMICLLGCIYFIPIPPYSLQFISTFLR